MRGTRMNPLTPRIGSWFYHKPNTARFIFRSFSHMVAAGIAESTDIDHTLMTSFGPRYTTVRKFETVDNAGLKLKISVDDYIFRELGTQDCAFQFLRDYVEHGELGVKTGKGVYGRPPEKSKELQERIIQPYL